MEYIDQNASELKLTLTTSDFDKEPLNVIMSKEINLNGYEIEFGILGASHFVSIKKDNLDFTEIFACVDIENTESMRLGDYLELTKQNTNFNYMFQGNIYDWNSGIAQSYYRMFEKNVIKYEGLTFQFPSQGDVLFQALTTINIYYNQLRDAINIETIHAYPNENKIVVTKSMIDSI